MPEGQNGCVGGGMGGQIGQHRANYQGGASCQGVRFFKINKVILLYYFFWYEENSQIHGGIFLDENSKKMA